MGGNSANTAKEKFPDEWDDVYGEDNAYAGTARQTLEQLDQQRQGMSRQDAIDSSRDRIRLKNAHDRAVMQKIYDDNREELEELARLQEAISTATTQKQIEDLQARINISQGTINAQQMRMQSMVSLQDAQQRLYQEQHRQAVRERLTGDGETLKSVSVPTWGN